MDQLGSDIPDEKAPLLRLIDRLIGESACSGTQNCLLKGTAETGISPELEFLERQQQEEQEAEATAFNSVSKKIGPANP